MAKSLLGLLVIIASSIDFSLPTILRLMVDSLGALLMFSVWAINVPTRQLEIDKFYSSNYRPTFVRGRYQDFDQGNLVRQGRVSLNSIPVCRN